MLFATDGMNAAADEIDVLVREPLGPNAGSILREVWLDAYGARLTDVANAEGYPLEPTFSELMPALEGPLRFYGALRGPLPGLSSLSQPTETTSSLSPAMTIAA